MLILAPGQQISIFFKRENRAGKVLPNFFLDTL